MIKHFKDLITSVDLLNTLHGGVSEPFLSFREEPTGKELRVRVPGLGKEALQVAIINNELSIYYLLPIESSHRLLHMPQIVYNEKIPGFVEASGIKAAFENDELVVKLPYNERYNGFDRKIQIGEE